MDDRFETRSDELNELLSGGFRKGTGSLIRYEEEGIADEVSLALGIDVFDNLLSSVLIPRASISSVVAEEILDRLNVSLDSLLDNDQLFVIDTRGGWADCDHRNVFAADTLSDIQTATETALDRSQARGTVHIVDIGAVVATVGEPQARELREWYTDGVLRGSRDFLLETAHIPPLSEELVSFYESIDDQVLRFYKEGDAVRVRIDSGPEAMVGAVRTVEYLDEPPFIRVR